MTLTLIIPFLDRGMGAGEATGAGVVADEAEQEFHPALPSLLLPTLTILKRLLVAGCILGTGVLIGAILVGHQGQVSIIMS